MFRTTLNILRKGKFPKKMKKEESANEPTLPGKGKFPKKMEKEESMNEPTLPGKRKFPKKMKEELSTNEPTLPGKRKFPKKIKKEKSMNEPTLPDRREDQEKDEQEQETNISGDANNNEDDDPVIAGIKLSEIYCVSQFVEVIITYPKTKKVRAKKRDYPCPHCSKFYASSSGLYRHKRKEHTNTIVRKTKKARK